MKVLIQENHHPLLQLQLNEDLLHLHHLPLRQKQLHRHRHQQPPNSQQLNFGGVQTIQNYKTHVPNVFQLYILYLHLLHMDF
jgi:hypothetical protein